MKRTTETVSKYKNDPNKNIGFLNSINMGLFTPNGISGNL
jgi:hypothetical protein